MKDTFWQLVTSCGIEKLEGWMKNILAIYLKQHNLSREELIKASTISLSKWKQTRNKSIDKWNPEIIQLLSNCVNQDSQTVLNRLNYIAVSDELFEVDTLEELEQMVKEKEDEFVVTEKLNGLMLEMKKSQLNASEESGFQLGSSGWGSVLSFGILHFVNRFANYSRQESLKQAISALYTINCISDTSTKLRLKQLDY